jgi:uncharacterized membrane protein
MAQGDYIDMERDSGRTLMHILYGMHTVAPFTLWTLSLIALVIHYVKRSDERNLLFVAHHTYMIRTVWWTALWLLLTGPLWLLLFLPGAAAYTLIGLWYLYRCLRGWLRFNDNRMPEDSAFQP